jgi:hypothetical protein
MDGDISMMLLFPFLPHHLFLILDQQGSTLEDSYLPNERMRLTF